VAQKRLKKLTFGARSPTVTFCGYRLAISSWAGEALPVKLANVADYTVTGFPFPGGWRLQVQHSTWPAERSYWFVGGKFYESRVDLEPKSMNEIGLSQIALVFPEPGAVEAMQAAIIQWHYEEPKSGRA
jgi:hypothetical protein